MGGSGLRRAGWTIDLLARQPASLVWRKSAVAAPLTTTSVFSGGRVMQGGRRRLLGVGGWVCLDGSFFPLRQSRIYQWLEVGALTVLASLDSGFRLVDWA